MAQSNSSPVVVTQMVAVVSTQMVESTVATTTNAPKPSRADISFGLRLHSPDSGDMYDSAGGLGGTLRFWSSSTLGVWMEADFVTFEVNEMESVAANTSVAYSAKQSGNATAFYVGGGPILRPVHQNGMNLSLFAGPMLVPVSSSVEISGTMRTRYSAVYASETLEIDPQVIARMGADADVRIGRTVMLTLSAGYDADLVKGDITMPSLGKTSENELAGYWMQFGMLFEM
jgi:hypothetical protein